MKYMVVLALFAALGACGDKAKAPADDMAGMEMPAQAPVPAVAPVVVQVGDIIVSDPWAPVTPIGGRVAAGYLTLKNSGQTEDKLIGFSSPSAKTVELHEMLEEGGMMKMQAKPELTLKAGEEVSLAPGGLHLMLMEPALPFENGQELPLTLTFEKAGKVDVKLLVRPRVAAAAPEHDGH